MTSLVFHPVPRMPGSTAFADAVKVVLDATPGELRLVSPYLHGGILGPIIRGRPFRLVTDLDACFGGPVDESLVDAMSRHACQIRHLERVHAKVVLGASKALVGSANLTTSGFSDRFEMACLLHDEGVVRELHMWFESLWGIGRPIDTEQVRASAARGASARESQGGDHPQAWHPTPGGGAGGSLGWMKVRHPLAPPPAPFGEVEPPHDASFAAELDELARQLARHVVSRRDARAVLDRLAAALDATGLGMDDPRLHLKFGGRHIAITVNQRDVAWIERRRGGTVFGMILDDFAIARDAAGLLRGAWTDEFRRNKAADAPSLRVPIAELDRIPRAVLESWVRGIQREVPRGSRSSYVKHKRPSLYRILRDGHLRQEVMGLAFPQSWWFGVKNGDGGHIQLRTLRPLLDGLVPEFKWPVGNSRPKAEYPDMAPGDRVVLWTGHGRDLRWGVLGTARIARAAADHVLLVAGSAFPIPLTPYPKKKPEDTEVARFLIATLGAGFGPLGDVERSIYGGPRRPPVTVAPISPEALAAIEDRALRQR